MSVYGYSAQYNDGLHQQNGFAPSHLRQNSYYSNSSYHYGVNAATTNNCYDQQSYGYNNSYAPVDQMSSSESRSVGGVSSVLDYDITTMSKFTTYLAFRLFQRSDTDNPYIVSKIHKILSAVRLPLSSLILANYYLLGKYEKRNSYFAENKSEETILQNIILSLLLANKSNDDNTFTNRSWSDATGLSVRVLNSLEVEWLIMFDWKLHDTNFDRYFELKGQFEKYSDALKVQQHQQFQGHQYSQSINGQYRDPISPIINKNEFSPTQPISSRFNQFQQSSWLQQPNYNYQSSTSFEQPSSYYQGHRSHHSQVGSNYYYGSHRKTYSMQDPDYCSGTTYCDCRYCYSTTRAVNWSYNNNNMLASAY